MTLPTPKGGGFPAAPLTEGWLREHLGADRLIVTPMIRRVCSLYAVGMAMGSVEAKEMRTHAAYFLGMAESLAASLRVELDTDSDGTADLRIDLSTNRLRRC